eukprot:11416774-Alexandrium_andersonii.AAC.1
MHQCAYMRTRAAGYWDLTTFTPPGPHGVGTPGPRRQDPSAVDATVLSGREHEQLHGHGDER